MARSVVMKVAQVMVDTVTIYIIARTIEGFYFVGGGYVEDGVQSQKEA
jgi:Ethanolamine utilization protein EutJ (predicted chaperonin)